MRFCEIHNTTKWIYLVIFGVLLSGKTLSQGVCSGKWNAPIWQENFGVGTRPVSLSEAGSTAVTSYKLVTHDCPDDGQYAVTRATGEGVVITCFNNAWPTIRQDHTGQTNGRFVIFNASYTQGQFYEQKINGLCGGRGYEFGVWAASILFPHICSGVGINPNLTFRIETASGVLLKTYNTGAFPKTDPFEWQNFKIDFELPKGQHQVVVKISNVAGGCGNDIAIDDLSLRMCQPQVSVISSATNAQHCVGTPVELFSNLGTHTDLVLQWQQSAPKSNLWRNIIGANKSQTFINAQQDTQYRLLMAADSGSFHAQCAWPSDTVALVVKPLSAACVGTLQVGFYDGETVNLSNLLGDSLKTNVSWLSSNPSIGLPSAGSGSVPNFTATNAGNSPIETSLTITSNTSVQQKITLKITVYPQIKPFAVAGGGVLESPETQKAVSLSGSQEGVKYVLVKNDLPTALVVEGSGEPFSFGAYPTGIYTATAYWQNAQSLAKPMIGKAVVSNFGCPPQSPLVVPSSQAVCAGMPLESLFGFVDDGFTVDWYDAPTGGNLLLAGSLEYKPTGAGVFYALARNIQTNCSGTSRASSTVEVFEKPVFELKSIESSCDGETAKNDAQIAISNLRNGQRFDLNAGLTYTNGKTYETALEIAADSVLSNNLPNPAMSQVYTVRVFGAAGCFKDLNVTLARKTCTFCPPQGPSVVPTSQRVCALDDIEPLKGYTASPDVTVDWYDAPAGGRLLAQGQLSYKPVSGGLFYAQARVSSTGCINTDRAVSRVEVTNKPVVELEIIPPTCVGDVPQNDAKIIITNPQSNTRFSFVKGEFTTTQDRDFDSAAAVPMDGVLVDNIENPDFFKVFYTIRIFDENGCFSDKIAFIEPFQCNCGTCVLLKMKRKTKSK